MNAPKKRWYELIKYDALHNKYDASFPPKSENHELNLKQLKSKLGAQLVLTVHKSMITEEKFVKRVLFK